MRHAFHILVCALVCTLAQGTPARAQTRDALDASLVEARRALDALDVERAAQVLESLVATHGDDPTVLAELGQLRLHQGRYAGAVAALTRSLERMPAGPARDWRPATLELAQATRDATADFLEARSTDGRYVVRYPPGQAVLAPYALDTLRRADEALTRELGGRTPRPLRLEIYASPMDLARVSPLTVAQIETTGTIALSKWDRLMLTSPQALVHGYPWRDTITHELTHLLLTRATGNQAPVWLQEGVAKLLERSWREPLASATLDPASRELLRTAVRDGELIPFSRMHPSIALLPSQERAALAFAEVTSFVGRYRARLGPGSLRALEARLRAGEDARAAMAAGSGSSFAQLKAEWRASIAQAQGPEAATSPGFIPLRFRHGDAQEGDTQEVLDTEARRRVRLGDLLRDAGRALASRVEYEAALTAAPQDPSVAWRVARAALAAGAADRAQALLQGMATRAPEFEPVRAWLAEAYRAQANLGAAAREARAAIGLNPFDPMPHCVLGEAGEDEAERSREGQFCSALR